MEQRVIPRSDARLWPDEYDVTRGVDDDDGMYFISISMFFNDDFDRGNFRSFLGPFNGLNGEIKIADSWHDEKQENGAPIKSCKLTEPIEVIE